MHVLVLTIERSYYVHGTNTIIIEKLVFLVGFIIRIYHDARSSEYPNALNF